VASSAAGVLFAFPGLEESVGMVYLEAQACGLPVVATEDEGAPHVIAHERSGLITKVSPDAFTNGMWTGCCATPNLCVALGAQAPGHVAREHDAARNYGRVVEVLRELAEARA